MTKPFARMTILARTLFCARAGAALAAALLLALASFAASPARALDFASFTLDKNTYRIPGSAPEAADPAKKIFASKLKLQGSFTLGVGNDGLDLTTESIRISLGDVVEEIAPGAIAVRGKKAFYKYRGLNGLRQVKLVEKAPGQWDFTIKGTRLLLDQPARVTIQIGDDVGQYDVLTAASVTPAVSVTGEIVGGDPLAGLSRVGVTTACASGTCTGSSSEGFFRLDALAGAQTVYIDGSAQGYARLSRQVTLKPGANDLGLIVLPAISAGGAQSLGAGVQGSAVTAVSSTLSSGGTASVTVPAGATVTFPSSLASPQMLSISEVPLDQISTPFPPAAAGPIVLSVEPAGATSSPCADLLLPNVLGAGDGSMVTLYGYDGAGGFVPIGSGVVQNGATEIFGAGVLCTFGAVFPACAPGVTDVVGRITRHGVHLPNIPVQARGAQTRTIDPPADLDADGTPDNFKIASLTFGCASSTPQIKATGRLHRAGTLIESSLPATAAVDGGTTRVGEAGIGYAACSMPPVGELQPMFYYPRDVGVDAAGNVHVIDLHGRVTKLDSAGNVLLTWDGGKFEKAYGLYGLAVDAAGNVYVAAPHSDRILKFDANGNLLLKISGGELDEPTSVAVAPSGEIYVGARFAVSKFSAAGQLLARWTTIGSYSFYGPGGLAIDAAGNVYAVDSSSEMSRLVKFDSNGGLLAEWMLSGALNAVTVDNAGYVYVAVYQGGVDRIRKFDPLGNLVGDWGAVPVATTETAGLAVGPTGNLYVVDSSHGRVVVFDSSDGTQVDEWGTWNGQVSGGPAVDGLGNLYIFYEGASTIIKYDSNLQFQRKWFAPGSYSLAGAPDGGVYAASYDNASIRKYDVDGNLLTEWGTPGWGYGQLGTGVNSMAVDSDGNLHVVDNGFSRVQKFDPLGNFLLVYGEEDQRASIASGAPGRMLVWQVVPPGLDVFDNSGNFLYSPVLTPGGSWWPDFTLAPDGSIFQHHAYAAHSPDDKNRIERLSPSGLLQRVWEPPKCTGVSFDFYPLRMTTDGRGNLIVNGNRCIFKFRCP